MAELSKSVLSEIERTVRDNPGATVTVLDSKGVFQYASPSVKDILGYAPEEVLGRTYAEFFDTTDVPQIELALRDVLLNGESVEITRKVKLKSGEYRLTRGRGHTVVDEKTGESYIISLGVPVK